MLSSKAFAKRLLLFLVEGLDVREGPWHVNHNGGGPLVLRLAETFVTRQIGGERLDVVTALSDGSG